MFDKQWVMNKSDYDKNRGVYQNDMQMPHFINLLLRSRVAEENFSPEKYLNPVLEDLSSPFDIEGITDAVDRILIAQEAGEKVTVFGDYDCDGISATFVIYHFLKKYMKMDVDYYIPNRLTEGYGMSQVSSVQIAQNGTTLIITVDNGISAVDEIALLAQMGVDVVVTDHHKKPDNLPECCAVVDPVDCPDCDPNRYLAGCGVAFKLVCALAAELGIDDVVEQYIPVVTIGTIGDSVALKGDNRIIASYGLANMKNSVIKGLRALINLLPARATSVQTVTSSYVMYSIVPKINAAGRLGNAHRALELLLCENEKDAADIARKLIDENTKRQEMESEIVSQALQPENILTQDNDSVVVAYNKDWHHGVIGIVASRLTDKYKKPAFVMSALDEEQKQIVGSGRSVDGYDLHRAVSYAKEYVVKFGGHEAACGLTLEYDKVRSFIDKINEYTKQVEEKKALPPAHIVIDAIVSPEEITVDGVKWLNKLEPFGVGNPEPVLCIKNLQVERVGLVGNDGKHVKMKFSYIDADGGKRYLDGISFSKSAYAPLIGKIKSAAVIFTPTINTWNGNTEVSLQILDMCDGEYSIDNNIRCVYNDAYITAPGYILNRALMVAVYKAICNMPPKFGSDDIIRIREVLLQHDICCTWYALKTAINVFTELGLIKKSSKGTYEIAASRKVELSSSSIFKSHMEAK